MPENHMPDQVTTERRAPSKILTVMVSIGQEDADRSIEELEAQVRTTLSGGKVNAKMVTVTTAYYLVDGKVCLPRDYDPGTRGFRPGAFPPPWAGGPAENRKSVTVAPVDEPPRDYVRVEPTRNNERGPNGRRVRRDRGVARGQRAATVDTL